MIRESMVVYQSWLNAIHELPEAMQGELALALLEVGMEGQVTCKIGQTTKAMLALIRPMIEANNKRYENGKKGGEFGVRGGRPKKPQENPEETPQKPQENPYNVLCNMSNVLCNMEDVVEESTTTPAPECANGVFIPSADLAERMKADTRWLAAVSANTSTPIDTLKALLDDFGKQVAMTEDTKELVDARRHFLSWMRKRKQAPTGRPTDGGRPYRLMTYEQMIADKERNGRATTDAYVAVKVRGQSKPMWVTRADKEAYQIPDEI